MNRWKNRMQAEPGGIPVTIVRFLDIGLGEERYLVRGESGFLQLRVISDDHRKAEEIRSRVELQEKNYERLRSAGIPVLKMICADAERGMILQEYREGDAASQWLLRGELSGAMLQQVRDMAERAETAGFCLDYFPTAFRICEHRVIYDRCEILPMEDVNTFGRLAGSYWLSGEGMTDRYDRTVTSG